MPDAIWMDIKTRGLNTGDRIPLMEIVEKFMVEHDADPDELAEGFEELVEKGWLEEKDEAAYLTAAGFAALAA